jgi:Zn-dependent protease/dihydrofolate reductase
MIPSKKGKDRKSGGHRFDESWAFLLTFLFYSSAFELFPKISPDHTASFYLFSGVFVCLLYLLAVLIHEAGHLVGARMTKFPYDGETFSIWGGRPGRVSSLLASDPRIMVVRMAGPLANLIVGAGIYFWLPGGDGDPVIWELWLFFAKSNLIIAFINMLPVLPFDMGALVLSRFGMRKKESYSGDERDFRSSVIFGWLLTVSGILLSGRGSFITGFATVVLGVLLIRSSLSWRERLGLASYLEKDGIDWAITVASKPLNAQDTLEQAMEEFRRQGGNSLPVVDDQGSLIGKMDWKFLRKKPVESWHLYPVAELMVPILPEESFSIDPPDVTQRIFDLLHDNRPFIWIVSSGKFLGQLVPEKLIDRFRLDRSFSEDLQSFRDRVAKTGREDPPTS